IFERVEPVHADSWEELSELRVQSRERNVEGLMLKHLDSAYGTARQRGAWWKWKIDPFTIDAVMLYAQPGHGRPARLFTDYTVWCVAERSTRADSKSLQRTRQQGNPRPRPMDTRPHGGALRASSLRATRAG